MAITYDQKALDSFGEQVFLGTVLGGSSILKSKLGKNYFLSMRSREPKWLVYKIQCMRNLFKTEVLTKDGNIFRCHSYACNYVTSKRPMLYDTSRVIIESTLDQLRDVGLAFWCVESGGNTCNNRKNFYLRVSHYSLENRLKILNYFNTILEIPCVYKEYANYSRIQFTVFGTDRLFEIIQPYLPSDDVSLL